MTTEYTPADRAALAEPVSALKTQIQAGLDTERAAQDAQRAQNAIADRNHFRAVTYGTGATVTDGGFPVPSALHAAWRSASAPAPVREAALALDEANADAARLSRAAIVARLKARSATLPSERLSRDDEATVAEAAEAEVTRVALRAARSLVTAAHVHRSEVLASVPGEIDAAQHDAEVALRALLLALDRRESALDLSGSRTEAHPLRAVPGLGSRWTQSRADLVAYVGGTTR